MTSTKVNAKDKAKTQGQQDKENKPKQTNLAKVGPLVVLVVLLSAVINLHSDKRRFEEEKDFPYPRIPRSSIV